MHFREASRQDERRVAAAAHLRDFRDIETGPEARIFEGMKTLRMVGIDKAKEGITTLEEILQVTADDH